MSNMRVVPKSITIPEVFLENEQPLERETTKFQSSFVTYTKDLQD